LVNKTKAAAITRGRFGFPSRGGQGKGREAWTRSARTVAGWTPAA